MRVIGGVMWAVLSLYTVAFVVIFYPGIFKYVMLLFIIGTVSTMAGVAYALGVFNEPSKK